jgi:hypothetical protein
VHAEIRINAHTNIYLRSYKNITLNINLVAKLIYFFFDALIPVIEELLPNWAQGWEKVAALYQACSGEMILWDRNDVKWHWIEKCCNKFKKPTGNPGEPKMDMILSRQRIQQRIHHKTSSSIMGVESGGDDGLSLLNEEDESEEEEEEVVAVAKAEVFVGGIGLGTNSRISTPTNFVDSVGGVVVVNPEEVGIAPVPPLTQQSTEGTFWHVPQYQQTNNQLLFTSPDAMFRPQQRFQHSLIIRGGNTMKQPELFMEIFLSPSDEKMGGKAPNEKQQLYESFETFSWLQDVEPLQDGKHSISVVSKHQNGVLPKLKFRK